LKWPRDDGADSSDRCNIDVREVAAMVKGKPGPEPQWAKRERFAVLIGEGRTTADAARDVVADGAGAKLQIPLTQRADGVTARVADSPGREAT
jgi:hypothetical protein